VAVEQVNLELELLPLQDNLPLKRSISLRSSRRSQQQQLRKSKYPTSLPSRRDRSRRAAGRRRGGVRWWWGGGRGVIRRLGRRRWRMLGGCIILRKLRSSCPFSPFPPKSRIASRLLSFPSLPPYPNPLFPLSYIQELHPTLYIHLISSHLLFFPRLASPQSTLDTSRLLSLPSSLSLSLSLSLTLVSLFVRSFVRCVLIVSFFGARLWLPSQYPTLRCNLLFLYHLE